MNAMTKEPAAILSNLREAADLLDDQGLDVFSKHTYHISASLMENDPESTLSSMADCRGELVELAQSVNWFNPLVKRQCFY